MNVRREKLVYMKRIAEDQRFSVHKRLEKIHEILDNILKIKDVSKVKRRIGTNVPTRLTWEQKNPIDYLYHPSKTMIRLRKEREKKL